jgi:hypothetical protein
VSEHVFLKVLKVEKLRVVSKDLNDHFELNLFKLSKVKLNICDKSWLIEINFVDVIVVLLLKPSYLINWKDNLI